MSSNLGQQGLGYYNNDKKYPGYKETKVYYTDQKIVGSFNLSDSIVYKVSRDKVTQEKFWGGKASQGMSDQDKKAQVTKYKASDKQCQLATQKQQKVISVTKKNINVVRRTMPYEQYFSPSYSGKYYFINEEGKQLLQSIKNEYKNGQPTKLYVFWAVVENGKLVVKNFDCYANFSTYGKTYSETITRNITVPCKKYEIAHVIYTKQTTKYCISKTTGKKQIFFQKETFLTQLPISDERKKLQEQKSQLQLKKSNLQDQKNKLEKELEKKYDSLYSSDKLKQLQSQYDTIKKQFDKLRKQHSDLFKQLEEIWKKRENIWKEKQDKEKQLNNWSTSEQYWKIKNQITALNNELKTLEATEEPISKAFDQKGKQFDQVYKQLEAIQKQIEEQQKNVNQNSQSVQKQIDNLNNQIQQVQDQISDTDYDISEVDSQLSQLNDPSSYDVLELLGLKNQHTQTLDIYYSVAKVLNLKDLNAQNYEKQMAQLQKDYQREKSSDRTENHPKGEDACKNECKDPGCFDLGTGQSNNKAFMAQLQKKAAQYKEKYPSKDYNSCIRETEGGVTYSGQNNISQYNYQSHFKICFTCKNKYLSQ